VITFEAHLVFKCNWCGGVHLHGRAGGTGHRASHCRHAPRDGYILEILAD